MKKIYSHILAPALVTVLFACSDPKNNESLLSEAHKQIVAGEHSAAAINLKNILQRDPEHVEARFLLGKTYLNNDNFLSAEKELKRALLKKPMHEQAAILLAKSQLSLNQYNFAINTIKDRTFSNEEDNLYSLLILAQAHLGIENLDIAKDKISQANNINSAHKYSKLGNALIAGYQQKNDDSLEILNELIASNKDFSEAWILKGVIHSKSEQYIEAAKAYLAYYKLKPQNFAIRTLVAHNYIKAGKFELATPHIEELRKINDNHPTINMLAAQSAYFDRNYPLAKELANQVLNITDNGLAQMISGLSSYHIGENEQAYYQLNAIVDLLPSNHLVHKILAILQVKLGYQEELDTSLNKFAELNSDDASLFTNMGKEYINRGDINAAKEMFNKASLLEPTNATIKTQLGILKLSNADSSGVAELEKAIELNPEFKTANIALAMNYANSGAIDKAEKIASKWLQQNKGNAAAYILNGNIALKASKVEEAKQFFNQAIKSDPTSVVAYFNLSAIAADAGEIVTSNQLLDKIFTLDLEYPYAYRLAISNALKENKSEALENKLNKLIANSPTAIWPRVTLARRYLIKNNPAEATKILEALTDFTALPNVYFQALSTALESDKQEEKLKQMFTRWQKAQPTNESAYLSLIRYYDKNKAYQNALDNVNSALNLEFFKNHFQLLSLQAYYLLATSQYELADKKINRLATNDPEHSFVLRLQGQLAMANQEYRKAIDFFQRSFEKNAKDETVLYLAYSYKNNNQIHEAIRVLEESSKNAPNNAAFKSLLAELYIETSSDKAIKNYKQALEKEPNNFAARNNLAWVLYENENYSEAEVHARKAVSLSPNHPQLLDTLGLVLIKQNKLSEAIITLNKAHEIIPTDKEIIAHLVQAYEANNQNDKAAKLSEKLSVL